MKKTTSDRAPPKTIVKMITEISLRHDKWQVFSDFAEMAAISISNAVDLHHFKEREARYMEVVKRYTKDELNQFPQMLGELIRELDGVTDDVLGRVFHELELHNNFSGQYFTPFSVCRLMAQMIIAENPAIKSKILEQTFITAQEPACGSGAMVIALANELRAAGINYQKHLHVVAIDVDPKCVHMAYLQFSLLHIPAIVIHGNTLMAEEYARWYTPAHILGGWNQRLQERNGVEAAQSLPPVKEIAASEPTTDQEQSTESPLQLNLF